LTYQFLLETEIHNNGFPLTLEKVERLANTWENEEQRHFIIDLWKLERIIRGISKFPYTAKSFRDEYLSDWRLRNGTMSPLGIETHFDFLVEMHESNATRSTATDSHVHSKALYEKYFRSGLVVTPSNLKTLASDEFSRNPSFSTLVELERYVKHQFVISKALVGFEVMALTQQQMMKRIRFEAAVLQCILVILGLLAGYYGDAKVLLPNRVGLFVLAQMFMFGCFWCIVMLAFAQKIACPVGLFQGFIRTSYFSPEYVQLEDEVAKCDARRRALKFIPAATLGMVMLFGYLNFVQIYL